MVTARVSRAMTVKPDSDLRYNGPMDTTDKPLDVVEEIAEVARVALDEVLLVSKSDERGNSVWLGAFIQAFMAAAGDNMARPERLEDVERFAERVAEKMLVDPEVKDTLACLVRNAVHAYMRPE